MEESKRAVHALNRLSFGPQPGDVERVQQIGVDKWIEQQLHPEKIDDSGLEARLAPLRTLKMDTRAMVENFPPPQVLKAVADGRISMPSDPMKRAIYTAGIEQYKAKQERKQEAGKDANQGNSDAAAAKKNGDAADLAMDPEDTVPAFVHELASFDCVVASRYSGIKADYPLRRRIASRGYQMLTLALFGLPLKDTQSGFLGVRKQALQALHLTADGFEIHVEMYAKLLRAGFSIKEIPIRFVHQTESGEVSVFKAAPRMLVGSLRIRYALAKSKTPSHADAVKIP